MDVLSFLKANCILTSTQQPLFNRIGGKFQWVLDIRRALLNPEAMAAIANAFLDEHKPPYQLAAVESSGIPLMAAIQTEALRRGLKINGLIVRKKRKKHLQQSHIDGLPDGTQAILIDDSLNSGASLCNAAVKLRDAGVQVERAFVVVNFYSRTGVQNLIDHKIFSTSMYDLDDVGLTFKDPHVPVTRCGVAWTFASQKPNLSFAVCKSTPVLYKQSIMFGSDCGTFWCLDSKTGRMKWWHSFDDKTGKGIISSPCLVGDKVYFGTYTGELLCVNADTGKIVWSQKVCDWIGSSPCVAEGMLYVGLEFRGNQNGGALGCFDAATGVLKWRHGFQRQLHGSPVYSPSRKMVILGTNDGTMCSFEHDTGKLVQELKGLKAVKYHVAIKDDLAVFGAFDGKAYVWDYVTGEVKFTYQTDDLLYMRPLIVGDRAFLGSSDHQFLVIDLKTMSLVAALDVGEKVHSSPSFINGLVYFGTSKGELFGIDPITLHVLVRLQFPERLTNEVVSDGDMLFVYAFDNKMWAIRHD
jgi:outer membrane protein assembly factor BamB